MVRELMVTMSEAIPTRQPIEFRGRISNRKNARTTVGIAPTARRVDVARNNNLLRSWRSSNSDTREGQGQESDNR